MSQKSDLYKFLVSERVVVPNWGLRLAPTIPATAYRGPAETEVMLVRPDGTWVIMPARIEMDAHSPILDALTVTLLLPGMSEEYVPVGTEVVLPHEDPDSPIRLQVDRRRIE